MTPLEIVAALEQAVGLVEALAAAAKRAEAGDTTDAAVTEATARRKAARDRFLAAVNGLDEHEGGERSEPPREAETRSPSTPGGQT